MQETKGYVLRDGEGKFVGVNSISYDKDTDQYTYGYSDYLTNGYTYTTEELRAEENLINLQKAAKSIGFNKEFHIEKIDIYNTIMEESKLDVPSHPIVHVIIGKGKELAIA